MQAMSSDLVMRQKAWLTRGSKKGTAWRPETDHRVATKHWLCNLDNQYRLISQRGGLSFFKADYEKPLWPDWRRQPFCAIGMDFGSDGLSGAHAAGYHFGLNAEPFPDQSHAGNRSVYMGIKGAGLSGLILIGVVSWNLPHGPMQDQLRYRQCKEHMASCYRELTPENCP